MRRPLIARPLKGHIDIKALHDEIMRRFPKVMKRLHEAEIEEEKDNRA